MLLKLGLSTVYIGTMPVKKAIIIVGCYQLNFYILQIFAVVQLPKTNTSTWRVPCFLAYPLLRLVPLIVMIYIIYIIYIYIIYVYFHSKQWLTTTLSCYKVIPIFSKGDDANEISAFVQYLLKSTVVSGIV